MTRLFKKLLAQRGLDERFLYPKYDDLFDPFLMQDMSAAVARIEQARDTGERIVIFGDYDADGVTASTVMAEALEQFGCREVEILLPNRFTDGYGMRESALPRIKQTKATLVITVDNGSGSGAVISELKQRGIDTIVTDHHEIPELPADAVAVINPHRADEKYGQHLAGVGVAFMVARALNMRAHDGVCDGQEKWLLDLVVIGTICDSMLMRDENRILTYFGMLVLGKTRRVGLKELMKVAGVKPSKLDTHAIGFQIGPRLNAAGRMKSPELSLNLLRTKSRAEATTLAQELEALNQERREMQDVAVREIEAQQDLSAPVLIVDGKWHEGVMGIIAGRLLELYQKPAFALTEVEDGVLKGSGRSFGDFSLAEALQHCKKLLINGGGHALACGVSLRREQLEAFRKQMTKYYLSLNLQDQLRFLEQIADLKVDDLSELDETLYDEISLLEPFGDGNTEPIFETTATVVGRRVLKEKHLSVQLRDKKGNEMKMMAFSAPADWLAVETGQCLNVQFTLTKNEWRGATKIEGQLCGLHRVE